MLGHYLRRRPNINTAYVQKVVFVAIPLSQDKRITPEWPGMHCLHPRRMLFIDKTFLNAKDKCSRIRNKGAEC